jgi:hypothetical protein
MCGCSANFNGDERDIITQDELSRGFDFTGNRPSVIEVGETWQDPAFDFTGNRPSVIEVGEGSSFDFTGDLDGNTDFDSFLGKKAKARREERKATKNALKIGTTETTPTTETDPSLDPKNTYGKNWFGRNWHFLVIGAVVIGGGYYIYKKRK